MSVSADKDLEKQSKPNESQPLQGSATESTEYGTGDTAMAPTKSMAENFRGLVYKNTVEDSMTYHMEDLASWNSVLSLSFSVWRRRSLWLIFGKLMLLALLVAVLVLACCPRPDALKAFRFSKIGEFLRVFVGLLLGFFMSASVHRWWQCAGAFQHLLAAVRSLHMHLESLGVPEEYLMTCLTYGVGSAWMLHMDLHVEAMDLHEREAGMKAAWDKFKSGTQNDFEKFKDEELETLQSVQDPPGLLWMWIGSMIGFLAQEGEIPPLASPTYGRIMGVVSEGFNAIRDVRSSISMQAPYIYVQMLSSLVHINNIVNAISFGLTSGASVGTLLLHFGFHMHSHQRVRTEEATVDMQALLVSFFFSCFGPFVYQALLEVSVAIAQPFSNKDAIIPTERMILQLEKDLHDAMRGAGEVSWRRPRFKKTAS